MNPGDRGLRGRTPDGTSEARLDALRERAGRTGRVDGPVGAAERTVVGGPIPAGAPGDWRPPDPDGAEDRPGYYGLPVIKPPVWTWEIPVYFFVGGLAGMSALLAFASALGGAPGTARTAAWIAVTGSLISAALLVADLGRPRRFLHMLRVFKWRSPMSVGAWTLALFGGVSLVAAVALERAAGLPAAAGAGPGTLATASLAVAAGLGLVLSTYTGVLLAATAVPSWFSHRRLLPLHFGIAGLGSAGALLELLGHGSPALHLVGVGAAVAETVVGVAVELRRHGAADRALRRGRAGRLLRTAGLLAGPGALVLRLAGSIPAAALAFLAGALVSRFGWLEAGRQSGVDPAAALAAQRGDLARPS